MILEDFPSAEEFYATYWGKKPFVVRQAIDKDVFDGLIDGDTLAGLALEEDIKSRLVMTAPEGGKWTCDHGPFDDDKFATVGEKNWSLLVQNVEQYHLETANLLQSFHFSPRWLMDDIMVSYSVEGGSVGPHTDSYHVFLVQGIGKRKWQIGTSILQEEDCIEGLDLKVLKNGVEGEEIEVSMGDVIYIPPHFAHEGVTLEEAMTFSVGFLGPQLSELFVEYGHYLEQQEQVNKRYSGQGLGIESAGFTISPEAQETVQSKLVDAIQSDGFAKWLAEYFSTPTHDDVENIEGREDTLSSAEIRQRLQEGEGLHRAEHIKLSITTSSNGEINLAVYGEVVPTSKEHEKLIHFMNESNFISMKNIESLGDVGELMSVVEFLYNRNVLSFTF